jgi:hypothetical protein
MPTVPARRVRVCRFLIAERRLVGEHVGFAICPSPTWDILLDLYLARQEDRTIYIWSLCVASNIPLSSAHRKIAELIHQGLLARSSDNMDGRRVSISLTVGAYNRVERLLDAIGRQLAGSC